MSLCEACQRAVKIKFKAPTQKCIYLEIQKIVVLKNECNFLWKCVCMHAEARVNPVCLT